jgi:type IV secretion system protein VirD4
MARDSIVRFSMPFGQLALAAIVWTVLPDVALAQASSPFMTGATSLQTNILAWLTPVAVILVMVLGAMAMANRMLKSLAARIVFAPKDFSDAREISDELGFTTVAVRTVSKPVGAALDRRGSRSRSQTVSEQRRALLLPQEVKELGPEEAIVFYEGLRPIRCRKIRYFTDRRFRKRLRPAPAVPLPPRGSLPSAGPPGRVRPATPPVDVAGSQAPGIAAPAAAKEDVVIRQGTVEDIDRLESLTLEDFATDFSKVPIPDKEGPLSDAEMKVVVDAYLSSLERT